MSWTVEDAGATRWLILDRPPANVLDGPAIDALDALLAEVASRRDVKVVGLRSAHPRLFSAGVEVRDHAREHVGRMLERFHGVFRRLDALPQATLAVVEGACLGGGCELACFCDIVLATPDATFGQPEIDVGCFPPLASVLLPRIAPRAGAEMILSGRRMSADEAAAAGLVTRIVGDARKEGRLVAERIAGKSGAVLALARRAVRRGGEDEFWSALARSERLYREELMGTSDVDEGVAAFLEKRAPSWRDA